MIRSPLLQLLKVSPGLLRASSALDAGVDEALRTDAGATAVADAVAEAFGVVAEATGGGGEAVLAGMNVTVAGGAVTIVGGGGAIITSEAAPEVPGAALREIAPDTGATPA